MIELIEIIIPTIVILIHLYVDIIFTPEAKLCNKLKDNIINL